MNKYYFTLGILSGYCYIITTFFRPNVVGPITFKFLSNAQ